MRKNQYIKMPIGYRLYDKYLKYYGLIVSLENFVDDSVRYAKVFIKKFKNFFKLDIKVYKVSSKELRDFLETTNDKN